MVASEFELALNSCDNLLRHVAVSWNVIRTLMKPQSKSRDNTSSRARVVQLGKRTSIN